MSTICPKCGKENTVPFSDSVYKNYGFECEDCHKDFGVDDGKTLKSYEEDLQELSYERVYKDGKKERVMIKKEGDQITLTPSVVYPNKMLQPYEAMDITPMWDKLTIMFFEKMFILDWERINVGFITGKDDSFGLTLKFKTKPEIFYSGTNKFPPYFKVLEQLFGSFFVTEETK